MLSSALGDVFFDTEILSVRQIFVTAIEVGFL